MIAYKCVVVERDGSWRSIAEPDLAYRPGETLQQPARPDHRGGYYVHPTPEGALATGREALARYGGSLFAVCNLAVLAVEAAGPFVEYSGGKLAASAVTPLRVHPTRGTHNGRRVPESLLSTSPGRPRRSA